MGNNQYEFDLIDPNFPQLIKFEIKTMNKFYAQLIDNNCVNRNLDQTYYGVIDLDDLVK